LFIIL
jgi:hypothetical protein